VSPPVSSAASPASALAGSAAPSPAPASVDPDVAPPVRAEPAAFSPDAAPSVAPVPASPVSLPVSSAASPAGAPAEPAAPSVAPVPASSPPAPASADSDADLPSIVSFDVGPSMPRTPNLRFNPPRTLISFEPNIFEKKERENKYLAEIHKTKDGKYHFEPFGQDLETLKRKGWFKEISIKYKLKVIKNVAEAFFSFFSFGGGRAPRDLEPQNILFDINSNKAKIACHYDLDFDPPGLYKYPHCPQYVAPELCQTDDNNLSRNIYSFVVFVYELITGENFNINASTGTGNLEQRIAEIMKRLKKISFLAFRICEECSKVNPQERLSMHEILSAFIFLG
jgi:hypothetical protein